MANFKNTIDRLRNIILDKNCKNMNKSNIIGYLGELLVAQKILDEGYFIIQKGNQSGYDILVEKARNRKEIKIDVKCSTLKKEIKGCPLYWGWALRHKNKKRKIACTHFICVALDNKLEPLNYFVINKRNLNKFPSSAIRQFTNVKRSFAFLEYHKNINKIRDTNLKSHFLKCKILLDKNFVKKIKPKEKLFKNIH